MDDIDRALAEEAERLELDPDALSRTHDLARRRRRTRRLAAATTALVLGAAGFTTTWLAFRGPSPTPVTPGSPTPTATGSPTHTVSPSPSPLPAEPTRFVPATYREGGAEVMPVTFPDGTRLELVYPPSLGLAELGIVPNTYGFAEGDEFCGGNILARPFDQLGRIFGGNDPVASFDGPSGRAELWDGLRGEGQYLVFRFGRWQVLVPCLEGDNLSAAQAWADSLEGSAGEDGLLVLTASAPLTLAQVGDQYGPELYVAEGDPQIVLTLVNRCGDTEARREPDFARWCIQGQSVSLEVVVFQGTPDFSRQLEGGLRLRGVRKNA